MTNRPALTVLVSVAIGGLLADCGGSTLGTTGGAAGTFGGAGTTGVGGTTGFGGFSGGSGGAGPIVDCHFPDPVVCPANVCGNGSIDTCPLSTGTDPRCPTVTASEMCDGNALAGKTCRDFGFASGVLSCAPSCNGFVTSGCSDCGDAAAIVRCGPTAMTFAPVSFALAATDTQIALAWVEHPENQRPALWFARLSPSLDVVDASPLNDPAVDAKTDNAGNMYGVPVMVAPLPAGWVVAGWADPDLYFHVINSSGQRVARTVVGGPLTDDTIVNTPTLASRPNGGPLLVWGTAEAYHATVIADDGRSMTTPVDIPKGDHSIDLRNAVFVDGAFHVLFERSIGEATPGLRLARISTAGALLGVADMPRGAPTFLNASLVTGAAELRVIYDALLPNDLDRVGTFVQRIGPAGEALSPPRLSASYADGYYAGEGVAFGDDTFLMFAGLGVDSVGVMRLASDGTALTPPYEVTSAPIAQQRMIRRGPDTIVGWIDNPGAGPLNLARITP